MLTRPSSPARSSGAVSGRATRLEKGAAVADAKDDGLRGRAGSDDDKPTRPCPAGLGAPETSPVDDRRRSSGGRIGIARTAASCLCGAEGAKLTSLVSSVAVERRVSVRERSDVEDAAADSWRNRTSPGRCPWRFSSSSSKSETKASARRTDPTSAPTLDVLVRHPHDLRRLVPVIRRRALAPPPPALTKAVLAADRGHQCTLGALPPWAQWDDDKCAVVGGRVEAAEVEGGRGGSRRRRVVAGVDEPERAWPAWKARQPARARTRREGGRVRVRSIRASRVGQETDLHARQETWGRPWRTRGVAGDTNLLRATVCLARRARAWGAVQEQLARHACGAREGASSERDR